MGTISWCYHVHYFFISLLHNAPWLQLTVQCTRHTLIYSNTGCPKSLFLYFISLYFSTIGLGKQIILSKVVSFNLIHYFHTCCAIFWLEYSICVLPRQRCACASIFSSHIFFVFYSPNCSNSFLPFFSCLN